MKRCGHKASRLSYVTLFDLFLATIVAWNTDACHAGGDILVKKVSVVDEMGKGVPSEIRTMDPKDQEEHFVYTDKQGVARPNKRCPSGMRLVAKPNIDSVYEKVDQAPYCKDNVEVTLKMSNVKFVILKWAEMATKRNDHGTATALYMESAARFANSDPDAANGAETKAYEALAAKAGKKLKLYAFDPDQGKTVLTSDGVEYLMTYQTENKLPVTGSLDWATASAMSTREPFSYVKRAYQAADWSKEVGHLESPGKK